MVEEQCCCLSHEAKCQKESISTSESGEQAESSVTDIQSSNYGRAVIMFG